MTGGAGGDLDGTTFIYALCDPDTWEARYAGKADNPDTRLRGHWVEAGCYPHFAKSKWLASLRRRSQQLLLRILDVVPVNCWQDAERAWIRQLRSDGHRLLNGTDGGTGGAIPASQTPAARAKRNAANTGRRRTAAAKERMRDAALRRGPSSEVTRRRIADTIAARGLAAGERNPAARLTAAKVRQIRQAFADGTSREALAQEHGITPTNVWFIVAGRTWAAAGGPIVATKPRQRLSSEDVAQIRALAGRGIPQREIAARFGVDHTHVSKIVAGRARL